VSGSPFAWPFYADFADADEENGPSEAEIDAMEEERWIEDDIRRRSGEPL
jgi:hypothetical protein